MMWVNKREFLERFVSKQEFDKRIGRLEIGMIIVSAMSLMSMVFEIIRFVGGE